MRDILSLLLATLVLSSSFSSASPLSSPSLRFLASSDALATLSKLVAPELERALTGVALPDVEVNSHIGIKVYLRELVLASFTLDTHDDLFSFSPPSHLSLSLRSVTAKVNMNWEYTDGPLIDWKGTANDSVSDTSVSMALELGADSSTGKAKIAVASTDCDIGKLDITLHGDGGKLFNFIAKLIAPLLKQTVASQIESHLGSAVDSIFAALIAAVPISFPVADNVTFAWPLAGVSNTHGLQGTYYSDNHFHGSTHHAFYTDFDHLSVSAYHSIDVAGYFQPLVSGTYKFELHYKQRGKLDVAGVSAGSLQEWNIGMCWPEWGYHKTDAVKLTAGTFYPLRLRYQSGCGGGAVSVLVCPGGDDCHVLSPLNVTTIAENVAPIVVYPDYLEISAAAHSTFSGDPKSPNDTLAEHHTISDLPPLAGRNLGFRADDFVINDLVFRLVQAGALQMNVTQKDVPAGYPLSLNTTDFRLFLPDLYKAYPNDLMMFGIATNTSNPPSVQSVLNKGVVAHVPLLITFYVFPNGTHTDPVAVLQLNADAAASLFAEFVGDGVKNDSRLVGNLAYLNMTLRKRWERVPMPAFNATNFQNLINSLVESILVPIVNKKLRAGADVPLSFGPVRLVNTTLQFGDNVVELDSRLVLAQSAELSDVLDGLRASKFLVRDMLGALLYMCGLDA